MHSGLRVQSMWGEGRCGGAGGGGGGGGACTAGIQARFVIPKFSDAVSTDEFQIYHARHTQMLTFTNSSKFISSDEFHLSISELANSHSKLVN